jgi:hypothetical protein
MTTGTVLSETPTVWAELLLRRFLFRKKSVLPSPGTRPTHLCYNEMEIHYESMSFFERRSTC